MEDSKFDRLIVPEIPFLARVSRAMSKSGAEAEDLAQDTLLKAYRAIDSFDGRHPKAWLARIARNTAINRDERKREVLLDDESAFDSVPQAFGVDGPEDVVVDEQMDGHLQQALNALPEEFRLAVLLVDVGEMKYHEAAELLEIPVGTIMSRLHRARARLRAALSETHLAPRGKS